MRRFEDDGVFLLLRQGVGDQDLIAARFAIAGQLRVAFHARREVGQAVAVQRIVVGRIIKRLFHVGADRINKRHRRVLVADHLGVLLERHAVLFVFVLGLDHDLAEDLPTQRVEQGGDICVDDAALRRVDGDHQIVFDLDVPRQVRSGLHAGEVDGVMITVGAAELGFDKPFVGFLRPRILRRKGQRALEIVVVYRGDHDIGDVILGHVFGDEELRLDVLIERVVEIVLFEVLIQIGFADD